MFFRTQRGQHENVYQVDCVGAVVPIVVAVFPTPASQRRRATEEGFTLNVWWVEAGGRRGREDQWEGACVATNWKNGATTDN